MVNSIDSLQRLVNTHPKEDTTKVNLLNTLARFCLYDTQLKRGLINAREARLLAQKINYHKGEGMYLRALTILNENLELQIYFEIRTRWFYESIHEKETISLSEVSRRAIIDWKKADTELFAILDYAQKQQDKELTAVLLYLISEMYAASGKYDNSLVYADKSTQLYQAINQPTAAFFIMASKMVILDNLKRAREAKVVEAQLSSIITQTHDIKEKALLYRKIGVIYTATSHSNYALSLEYLFKANTLLEQIGETQLRVDILYRIGWIFNTLIMYKKASIYYSKAAALLDHLKNYPLVASRILMNLTYLNNKLKQFKEANLHIRQVNEIAKKWKINIDFFNYEARGEILMYQGHYREAIPYFHLSNEVYKVIGNRPKGHPFTNLYTGQCYLALGNLKESIIYGEKAYADIDYNRQELPLKTSLLLFEAYDKSGQTLKAYEYLKKHRALIKANEEQDLLNRSSTAEIEGIIQKSEQEKAALEREKLIKEAENQNQRWWLVTAAGILLSTIFLLTILYRSNKNKQKANALLQRQKEEINEQRTKVENALTDLKATQTQLIQKEKLASLGELTAGIAHEIQNPLNFVNNFSELSGELMEELKEERKKENGKRDESLEDEILGDIEQNLLKINHHGKRASNIVKGMLEHSRTSTGKKELTDLNSLADEYLRLAYHGLRAKDKNFNSDFKSDFDPNLPKIEIQAQDMGRVLMNLINNAFYAVARTGSSLVQVSTKKLADSIELRVRDNGTGIPENIKAKIFQPFFTTKPAGEGTGLGLSLAYDIVTKGHGGSLEVESVEGEGTEFIVRLPIQ